MNRCIFSLLCLLTIFSSTIGTATSIYFPKFGTPIIAGDRIVFSGPGMQPRRLICIEAQGGKKLWDITSGTNTLHPWFVQGEELLVTSSGDVHRCELKSGKLSRLYKTGYQRSRLLKQKPGFVLVDGERADVNYLSLVDSSRWQPVWETPRLLNVSAEGTDVLLCDAGTRKRVGGGGYTLIDRELAAVSRKDGKILWHRQMPQNVWGSKAVAISNFFVVALGGTLHCFKEADGEVLNTLKVNDSDIISPTLALRDGRALVWAQKGRDVFSGHVVFSLNVPEFVKTELTETDWYSATSVVYEDIVIGVTIGRVDAVHIPTGKKLWQGGQWNWDGILNGYIYFSDMERDGEHTSINRIQVKTGQREKIYEELLPEEMQWKKK
jgi:outer membrane protein assembly factor BamB